MERLQFLRRRNAFIIGVILFVVLLYIGQSPKVVKNVSPRVPGVIPQKPSPPVVIPQEPSAVYVEEAASSIHEQISAGNFTLWAKVTLTGSDSQTEEGVPQNSGRWEDGESDEQNDITDEYSIQLDEMRKTDVEMSNVRLSDGKTDTAHIERKTEENIVFDTETETDMVDSKEIPPKEEMSPPVSQFLPKGGNTLPNFLTKGIGLGLMPKDYQKGVITFLHHNKAAGSSIKSCLNLMTKRGIIENHHSLLIVSSKKISKTPKNDFQKYSVFVGGYSFWLCEQLEGQNCSYFTVMRNPYDRVLSSYFYCKNQPWDQLCGPLETSNFTIQEWAIYQGSYFFNQLLMNREYCQPNDHIRRLFDRGISDLIPRDTGHFISYEETKQCWFRQKVFLSRTLNETGRMHLLQYVLDNLETWFSVIGITEDFDLSLKMMSFTYRLPFFKRCRGKVLNKSHYVGSDKVEKEAIKERLKAVLTSDARVVEALKYDMMIYERGLQIFQRQKKRLDMILARNMQL